MKRAVRQLFGELADEFGGLDAVVNVAGISRPTGFAKGSDDDWLSVLSVHLDGYRNVLGAALPLMAAAGRGHILGVTSGSGWRAADAGAYGCAKRAVAVTHLAAGSARSRGRGGQRHLADRRHPHGGRRAGPRTADERIGHRRTVAGLDARARGPRPARRPPGRATRSRRATGGCCSPAAPKSR